ncbi:hypothetical protein NXZ36_26620, partial [Escherichia coli]|nr:hypothetical protein [Escherichia coli]
CFVRMFCGSFSLQAFLVVHVVFKSIHAVVACFAAVCRIIFSFVGDSFAIGVAQWWDAVKFYRGDS